MAGDSLTQICFLSFLPGQITRQHFLPSLELAVNTWWNSSNGIWVEVTCFFWGPGFLGSGCAFSLLAVPCCCLDERTLRPSGTEGAWAPGSRGRKLSGHAGTPPLGYYSKLSVYLLQLLVWTHLTEHAHVCKGVSVCVIPSVLEASKELVQKKRKEHPLLWAKLN